MMTPQIHLAVLAYPKMDDATFLHENRAFEWDPDALHELPDHAIKPVLVTVSSQGHVRVSSGLTSYVELIYATHWLMSQLQGPMNTLVMPHVKSLVLRSLTWARAAGLIQAPDDLIHPSSCVDMVDLINHPAMVDVTERRSWSVAKLRRCGLITGTPGALVQNNTPFCHVSSFASLHQSVTRLMGQQPPPQYTL